MVSLLLKQFLLTVNVYFAMSHVIPHHTALCISHTSQHSMSHTLQHISPLMHSTPHIYPTPHMPLQTLPLHPSLSLFRVQRDWKRGRIPVHRDTHAQPLCIWWRECPCVLPVTKWDGGCPSIPPSCLVWNNFIHLINIVWWDVEMFWLCIIYLWERYCYCIIFLTSFRC